MQTISRTVLAALALAGISLGQSVQDWKWPDISLFGGYQGWDLWRSKFGSRPGGQLVPGGTLGVRAGYDLMGRLGVEGAYTYGVNNLRLTRDGAGQVGFGARNHHVSLNPVWHFADREAKIRPYVTLGLGALWFKPTEEARRDIGLPNAGLGAFRMKTDLMPAFNWGGGVKYTLTEKLQLRFDLRNVITRQPHFGLPQNNVIPGGVFVAPGGAGAGLQATAGVGFALGDNNTFYGSNSSTGGGTSTITANTSTGQRPSKNAKALRMNLAGGASSLRPDKSFTLQASTDAPDPSILKYTWTINGLGTDVTGPEFAFHAKGREPGDYKICGTAVSSSRDWTPGSECYTVTVQPMPVVKATISEPVRINEGQRTRFAAGSDVPPGETVTYEWTLNGQPIAGATGPNYEFNAAGRQPGVYEVCVAAAGLGVSSQRTCSSVNVAACTNPALRIPTLANGEVFAGERVKIGAEAQMGGCGDPVTMSYRAGDGTISNAGEFDSTNVAFDRTNRSKLQRRSVPVTVTATDARGRTATAQTSVMVKLAPEAQRLDDILFASRNSRVNNCGKRVLLEMLAPRLRDDPEASVVLIGHIDETENGRGRPAARNGRRRRTVAAPPPLDKARVLNAAAVISAGEGICPTLELSRIKVGYAGKAQGSEARPMFCGGSTEVRATRRAAAKPDPRAQFRRVEVWIVPAGAAMPNGVSIADAPEGEIKALKCPK